jgi:phosphatidylglycerol:prolipoprotein diacylglycerol transferase
VLGILDHPNLDPVIFTLISNDAGSPVLALRWYGLMYVLAFTVGYLIFRWLQKTGYLRIEAKDVSNYVIVGVLGTFLGGRLGYLFFYQFDDLFLKAGLTFGERMWKIVAVWEGGMSFHGGVIGVTLAVLYYALRKKQNFWNIMDGSAHIVPLGVALVRIGNFINGELWGRTINNEAGKPIFDAEKLPWYAMKFPTDSDTPGAQARLRDALEESWLKANPGSSITEMPRDALQPLPVDADVWKQVSDYFPGRYPSQLVQFAFEGMLVLLAMWIIRRYVKRPGVMCGLFLIAYAIFRIPAEMIRQPDHQIDPAHAGELGGTAWFLAQMGMTMGQFLSVLIIAVGLGVVIGRLKWGKPDHDYTPEDRRGGFIVETLKDLSEIIGLRKPKQSAESQKDATS